MGAYRLILKNKKALWFLVKPQGLQRVENQPCKHEVSTGADAPVPDAQLVVHNFSLGNCSNQHT
jgi:hypothetical protein